MVTEEQTTRPTEGCFYTLEDALLYLDGLCDGAVESDGHGFNKKDSEVLRPRAEALRETGILDARKDTLKRITKYKNTQLKSAGFDYDAIKKSEQEKINQDKSQKVNDEIIVDPEVTEKAWKILADGDLVKARRNYIGKFIFGGEYVINALTYICHSTYLGSDVVIHADMIGDPEIGKSTATDKSIEEMPQEDVILLSDISPKYIFYKSKNTNFTRKILCLDDAKTENIPVLKALRNDTDGRQCHGTVIDGEAVDLVIKGRPAVIASMVKPLRDPQGQCTGRALQISTEKPPKEVEDKVHGKIRKNVGRKPLKRSSKNDQEKLVLQQASRILRDEGINEIIVPFDVDEPKGSGRRATAQFERLILVSAFIFQFQRPILHVGDRRFVLAVHEDLMNTLGILSGLGIGNTLKIAPKGIELLRLLPTQAPNMEDCIKSANVMTSQKLHELTTIPERTVTDHLADLYEAGVVSRQKMKAPGSPFAYWTDPEISKMINTTTSEDVSAEELLGRFRQESGSPKYDPIYSSDSVKGSIPSFFEELSEEEEDISVNLGLISNDESNVSPEEHYLKAWGTGLKIEAEHSIKFREIA